MDFKRQQVKISIKYIKFAYKLQQHIHLKLLETFKKYSGTFLLLIILRDTAALP